MSEQLYEQVDYQRPVRLVSVLLMRMRRVIPLGIAAMLVAACGSTFIVADAGSDASRDAAMDTSSGADASTDAPEDYAWWWFQFDARGFEFLDPPNVGEYPPPNGSPCSGCGPIANCHPITGWCCSGLDWCCTSSNEVLCKCGPKLGCLPPEVCCYLPDAFVPRCVANWNACPNHRTPWMPGGDDP